MGLIPSLFNIFGARIQVLPISLFSYVSLDTSLRDDFCGILAMNGNVDVGHSVVYSQH